MEQGVSKHWHIKVRRRGITQKKKMQHSQHDESLKSRSYISSLQRAQFRASSCSVCTLCENYFYRGKGVRTSNMLCKPQTSGSCISYVGIKFFRALKAERKLYLL